MPDSEAAKQSRMTEQLVQAPKTERKADAKHRTANYTSMMTVQEAQLTKPKKKSGFLNNTAPNLREFS